MSTTIQLRRGTAAAWTGADPTLAEGEVGWETDTGKFKFGDGLSAWTTLAYAAGGSLTVEGDTGSVSGVTTLQVEGAGGASVAVTEPVAGTALATVTASGGGGTQTIVPGPAAFRIALTGSPDGGTFTVIENAVMGTTTDPIAFDADGAAVLAAFVAVGYDGDDWGVAVIGPSGGPWVVSFVGSRYVGENVTDLTLDSNDLTGGTSPGVDISQVASDALEIVISIPPPQLPAYTAPDGTAVSITAGQSDTAPGTLSLFAGGHNAGGTGATASLAGGPGGFGSPAAVNVGGSGAALAAVQGGGGGAAQPGGSALLDSGAGDAGNDVSSYVQANGGSGSGQAGYLSVRTAGSTGPGPLVSDGTSVAYSQAAHVDPSTGTVEDVVNALIAAGLMVAS